MSTEDGDESMPRFDRDRPISAPVHTSSLRSKPKNGARLLSFVLQTAVMAVALSLFFLFAGVAAIAILHLFVAGRSLRRRQSVPTAVELLGGLSPNDLEELPCFEYSGHVADIDAVASSWDCAVCLEGFRDGDRCRVLPGCNHAFHAPCVDRWLVRSPVCPICRGGVRAVVRDRTVGWAYGLV